MMITTKDVNELIEAWETLGRFGKQEITFRLYKEDEKKLNNIIGLVSSMDSFNSKKSSVVASELKKLINALPKTYYNENNPNNGSYLFDQITLKGDDTIILRAVSTTNDRFYEEQKKIETLVRNFGINTLADEFTVRSEQYGYKMHETIIRLWWD